MAKSEFCYLYLTCTNTVEAGAIVARLLDQHLIVCAKQMPVSSSYWFKGEIEQSSEVMLLMTSHMDLFDEIEAEVANLHSYETFVLEAVTIAKISKDAESWMKEYLKANG